MRKVLLIACSKDKHRHLRRGSARCIYTGTLLRLSLRYARENELDAKILSAKYGFIDPDCVIDTYDLKLKSPYDGPWPEGSGFFVGGSLYFKNTPSRFKPLVDDATTLSSWIAGVRLLCMDKTPVARGERKMKQGGVTDVIFKRLLSGPVTKASLYKELCRRFGVRPGMMVTIDCQLRQDRIGVERWCALHRRGRYFWVTKRRL